MTDPDQQAKRIAKIFETLHKYDITVGLAMSPQGVQLEIVDGNELGLFAGRDFSWLFNQTELMKALCLMKVHEEEIIAILKGDDEGKAYLSDAGEIVLE